MFKKILFILVLVGFFPITGYTGIGTCPLTVKWKNSHENPLDVHAFVMTKRAIGTKKEQIIFNSSELYYLESNTEKNYSTGFTSRKSCNKRRRVLLEVECNNGSGKSKNILICGKNKRCGPSGPKSWSVKGTRVFNASEIGKFCD